MMPMRICHRSALLLSLVLLMMLPTSWDASAQQEPDHTKFWDDFEMGIKPDWVMDGSNFGMVNGQLHSLGQFTAYVGDIHWDHYAVEFDLVDLRYPSDLHVLIRRQSSSDYMSLYLYRHYSNNCRLKWVIVRKGKEQQIVNTDTNIFDYSSGCAGHYRIEALRNMYKVFKNGDQKVVFYQ